MGYDAKGVDVENKNGRPYGIVVRVVPAPESEPAEKLVCKVRETRMLFEDPRKGPSPNPYDSYKVRTDCNVTGRLSGSREDLEAWLASKEDGKNIPATARDDILRLVFDNPVAVEGVVRLEIWFDVFNLGRGRNHEEEDEETVYWYYDDIEYENGDEDDEDEPISTEVYLAMEIVTVTGNEGEELGCPICREDKVEVGSDIMRLTCGHVFHLRCISSWLFEHCRCPMCRYKFPTENYEDCSCVCMFCLYSNVSIRPS